MHGLAGSPSEEARDRDAPLSPANRHGHGPGRRSLRFQTSFANPIHCRGVALHSGHEVNLALLPVPAGFGICFQRTDLPGSPLIPALFDHVIDTRLSTVIGIADAPHIRVATIEHLMAALHANNITNALITLDGPETPVFDGSSAAFDFLIRCAGRQNLGSPCPIISVKQAMRVTGMHGAFAELRPQEGAFSLSVSIDFSAQAIGFQHRDITLSEAIFRRDICDSRTFVDMKEIEALRKAGLAKGGSLDNAIVVDGAKILNEGGFRYQDECARHKILDAIGDMYLAGAPIEGQFVGYKCGHEINNRLLRAVFADKANWRAISPLHGANAPLHAVA